MLDIDKIKQLVDMMVANDLVELSLRDGEVEVSLRRPGAEVQPGATTIMVPAAGGALPQEPATPTVTPDPEPVSEFVEIRSPMVGTFYASPDPESPAYVEPGSRVHADTVICIVEAMKVFNEIKAEVEGTIERVMVKNDQTVEYGQALFLVRPD